MFRLVLEPRSVAPGVQSSSFHSSAVQHRYGRQHRDGRKRDLFRPRWRQWQNIENLQKIGMIEDHLDFSLGLHRVIMPNYPIGDTKIKQRRPMKLATDVWKDRYYEQFPQDRMAFLHKGGGLADREWYKLPVERFLDYLEERLKYEDNETVAWRLALRDKEWEEEAKQMEKEVQRKQAAVLLQFDEEEWQHRDSIFEKLQEDADSDPRIDEHFARDRNEHLQFLVAQRMSNPTMRKIKINDVKMPFLDLMKWLQNYPEYRDHFDECIYWGDQPIHQALPKSMPAELRQDGEEAGDSDVLLDDLQFQMTGWAKDMLNLYWDKVDMSQVTDTKEKEKMDEKAISATLIRQNMIDNQDSWTEARLSNYMDWSPGAFPDVGAPADGSAEVLSKNLQKQPFVRAELEAEIASLFGETKRGKSE